MSRSDASVGDAEWAEKISVEEFFGATKVLWRARESVVTRCVVACGRVSTMMCPNLCEENLFSELCVVMMMK